MVIRRLRYELSFAESGDLNSGLVVSMKTMKTNPMMTGLDVARKIRRWSWGVLVLAGLSAGAAVQADDLVAAKLVMASSPLVHIQAKQVALSQLLASLANSTLINLHYPVIPPGVRVSGDCKGSQLAEMLECLLGSPQNLVVRFSAQGQPEEAWLLSGDFNRQHGVNADSANAASALNIEEEVLDPAQILANSQEMSERLQAMRAIKNGETVKDVALAKKLLTEALTDDNPLVRSTAIEGLSKIAGDSAVPQMLQLLNDNEYSVRVAVLVSGKQNRRFLQQAQTSGNEQVRSLAGDLLNKLSAEQAGAH